jgi:ABC-type nitrate/sulfonate/bicarbonate transport system permease component
MSSTTTIVLRTLKQRPTGNQGRRIALRVAVVIAALLVWHLFSLTALGRSGDVPSPIVAFERLFELWGTAVYWNAVATTMTSWGLGLLVSVIVGVPLGLIIGSNAKIEVSVRLIVDFLRTIPSIAFLPLALLMFGVDLRTPVILIFLAAVWPLLIQSTYAASQIDPVLKQVRRSFHLSWWQYIRFQFAPSALPFITTGLRIAATICLLTAIAVELLSGAPGVGSQLQGALIVSQSATLYAYVLTAGVLGILINVLLVWLQRVLIWWHPSVRGDAR